MGKEENQYASCLINLTNNEPETALEKGLKGSQRSEEVWGRLRMGSSSSAPAPLSQCSFFLSFLSLPIPALYFRISSLSRATVGSASGLGAAQCQQSRGVPWFQKAPFISPSLAIINSNAFIPCIIFCKK